MYYPSYDDYSDPTTDMNLSPWLRQQQQDTIVPSSPYMGGASFNQPPSPPQTPSPMFNYNFRQAPGAAQPSQFQANFKSPLPPQPMDEIPRPNQAPTQTALETEQESPLMTAYKKLLSQPEGAAHTAYADYLKRGYPVEQPTSKWRALGGMAMAGLGTYARNPNALKEATAFVDEPRTEALQRYGLEGTRLSQAANEEDRQQQNQLRNVAGMVTEQRNQATALHQQRQDQIAADNLKRKEAFDKIRAIKDARPEYEYYKQPGGNIIGINKFDPKDRFDTGVASMLMDKATEKALDLYDDEKKIEARGRQDRLTKQTEGAVNVTPNWQLHQPLNDDGTPAGPVVEYNTKTGDIRPAPGFKGNLKTPPKPGPGEVETTSTTKDVTPPSTFIQRHFPDVSPPPKKETETTTTRKPKVPDKTAPNKTVIPKKAETPTGVKNIPDTTETSVRYHDDTDGNTYVVESQDVDKFLKAHPKAKKVQK